MFVTTAGPTLVNAVRALIDDGCDDRVGVTGQNGESAQLWRRGRTARTWTLWTAGGSRRGVPHDGAMPRRPAPLPSSLPHAVFTVAEATEARVSIDRLRSGDLRRLGYGIYTRNDVALTEADLLMALTRTVPGAVARGLSAARYWKFPLPIRSQQWHAEPQVTPVHLTANGVAHRDTSILRWNRQCVPDTDIATIGDLRITGRVRTWLDLAQALPLDELVKIGDHLVRIPRPWAEQGRSRPYATPGQLSAAIRGYRSPGRPRLREALDLVRVGSDSPAETSLRLATLRAGLPLPVLNERVSENGVDLGEPDLAWPEWKLCVEHDGPDHLTKEQQERDIRRRERREAQGWVELQTVSVDLRHQGRRGVQRIAEALRRRGWRPESRAAARPGRPQPGTATQAGQPQPGAVAQAGHPQPASRTRAIADSIRPGP